MIYRKHRLSGGVRHRLFLAAAFVFAGACGSEDGLSPSAESPTAAAPSDSIPPADSSAAPIDSTLSSPDSLAPTDAGPAGATLAVGTQPGIVFGSQGMGPEDLNSIHTGTWVGGAISPDNVIAFLTGVRKKGGRAVIKMTMGSDKYITNADGTFSLSKWKGLVDRFRIVRTQLNQFISDGTLLGHFLIDEPGRAVRWGGKIISHSTIEAMAQYSKSIWPNMTTFARVVPSWLDDWPNAYRALDAGWLQYEANKGDVVKLVNAEVAAAKLKGLGLIVGLNILDGGNGSSGVRGWIRTKWAMSASEIRTYGTALLNQTYACGFYNWTYQYHGPTYYARTDIKSAMAALSLKAKAHVRTSCQM
ncbi:MAG TPA: hypothetical protein VHH32_03165 [Gemmatimonadales bacterium]|nr:hypothetical protein [Gemmatimonadales bacterium]